MLQLDKKIALNLIFAVGAIAVGFSAGDTHNRRVEQERMGYKYPPITIPVNECRTYENTYLCYGGLSNVGMKKIFSLNENEYPLTLSDNFYFYDKSQNKLSTFKVEKVTSDSLTIRYLGGFVVDEKDLKHGK